MNAGITERWLPINGWPEYEISDHGRVRYTSNGRLRKLTRTRDGYLRVVLKCRPQGRVKSLNVARAVYEAFICPIPQGLEVDHSNFVRDDNRIGNLSIKTHAENIEHSRGANRLKRKLSPSERRQACALRASGVRSNEIATRFNVSRQLIDQLVQNIEKPKIVGWKKLNDEAARDIVLQMQTPRHGLMTSLALKYGVSQVAIKKVLKKAA